MARPAVALCKYIQTCGRIDLPPKRAQAESGAADQFVGTHDPGVSVSLCVCQSCGEEGRRGVWEPSEKIRNDRRDRAAVGCAAPVDYSTPHTHTLLNLETLSTEFRYYLAATQFGAAKV